MEKVWLEINEDGQFVIIRRFAGRDECTVLTRKASRESAEVLLRIQGVEVPR